MAGSSFAEASLADIADFRNGKAISPQNYTPTGSHPVFGSNGEIARTNEVLNPKPVIAIGRVGAYCGCVHYIPRPSWVTDNAIVAQPKGSNDLRFLFYLLGSLELRRTAIGSAQPLMTQGGLKALRTPVPPLAEQKAIAAVLGALDDKIELNRRMNATLEAMARALFQSWFVDFDPVRAKLDGRKPDGLDKPTAALFPAAFQESPIGPIPKGWATLPLYDLATYVNGAAYTAFQPNGEGRGLPIIKIAELKAGVTDQTKYSDVQMPEKYRLRTGDILFSWSGNPDTSIDTFVWSHGAAWLNQHIFRVDPHHDEERSFVLATLKYLRPVFAEIARNKQTTGLGHVTAGDMQRLLIVKPDAPVLSAWDHQADPLFGAIFRNTMEAQTLAAIRDTFLPKLLSGELEPAI